MKILIIKLSPIEGLNSSTLRSLAVAKSFVENGDEVDYLTRPMDELQTINYGYYSDHINIIRTSSNKIYTAFVRGSKTKKWKKLLLNPIRFIFHKFSIYNNTKGIINTLSLDILPRTYYDMVISISDPKTSHLAALKFFKLGLEFKEWIQYWGDPLTIDITNKTIFPKVFLKNVEKRLMQKANKIYYASPITLSEQKKMFKSQSDKMQFIPTPYIKEKIYETTKNEKYVVGYFGAFKSTVRNIIPLYMSFASSDYYKFLLVGDSDLVFHSTDNIEVMDRQDVTHLESSVDLLVVLLNSKGTQIPGKIFHYAGTNKPILVILDGKYANQIKHYFSQFNRYYFCENKTEDIIKTIKIIKDEGRNFRPIEYFSYINLAQIMKS